MEEGCLCRRKGSGQPKTPEETVKNLAKPKEIATKKRSENPNSTNNKSTHPEETLDNKALLATNRSGHNGSGQANAQTELTCAVSQTEHI